MDENEYLEDLLFEEVNDDEVYIVTRYRLKRQCKIRHVKAVVTKQI